MARSTGGDGIVATGAFVMAASAFFGHLLVPRRCSLRKAGKALSPAGSGAFGVGYGVIEMLRCLADTAFLRDHRAEPGRQQSRGTRQWRPRRLQRCRPPSRMPGSISCAAPEAGADDAHNGRCPSADRNGPAKIAHIVRKTPRFDEMIVWYVTVLDAEVVFSDEHGAILTYGDEHHRIALVRMPRSFRWAGPVWGNRHRFRKFDHLAFAYGTLEELLKARRRVRQRGINPLGCLNHGRTTSLYYADPDGNRIELHADNFATHLELLDGLRDGAFELRTVRWAAALGRVRRWRPSWRAS